LSSNSPTTCPTAASCLSPFQYLLLSTSPHLHPFLLRPNRRSPNSVYYYPGLALELEATNACHYHHCSPARRPHLITLFYRCDSSAPRCLNGITRKLFVLARLFPQAISLEHPPTSEVPSSRICAFQNTPLFPSGWKIFTSHKCTGIILISDRHVIHQPLYIVRSGTPSTANSPALARDCLAAFQL
jgi:hypothetical protein